MNGFNSELHVSVVCLVYCDYPCEGSFSTILTSTGAGVSNVINVPKCNKGPKCNKIWP